MNNNQKYFLGLDLSTQSLKLCVLDEQSNEIYHEKVNFLNIIDENQNIIHFDANNGQTTAEQDVFLFLKSLDVGLKNLNEKFGKKISALSVSGQQHGSVYYSKNISFDSSLNLVENLQSSFATNLCPIWMDSSTSNQCKEMAEKFSQIHQQTGSRTFERFTYSQILKKYQIQQDIYNKTTHISLISSFVAEILTGKFISIDYGDASGMNLMDLKSKKYIQEMINYIPDLQKKLGDFPPIKSWQSVGTVNEYFINRFSALFDGNTIVVASTGDNLASMVGMGLLNSNYLAISLGTSDTLFGIINEEEIEKSLNPNTPIFASPLSSTQYLLLLCQKNGGLMREEIAQQNKLTWEQIEEYYFKSYKPSGFYGCFLQSPEIVPPINSPNSIQEIRNINQNCDISTVSPIEKVIILLEYKLISLKVNYQKDTFKKLILTGGACKNKILQQMASNIFGCNVYVQASEDSAAIGSALRAHHGYVNIITKQENDFYTLFNTCNAYKLEEVAQPDLIINEYYTNISQNVYNLEQQLIQQYPY